MDENQTPQRKPMFHKEDCSAEALVIKQNAVINFVDNPNKVDKDGHHIANLFFMCGTIVGYVSPAAQAYVRSLPKGQEPDLKKLRYAKCSKDGVDYVPILMMVGNSAQNTVATAGSYLLHK